MLRSTEIIQQAGFGERIFTERELAHLFGGTPARRYGLVNKALAKNELVKIRRGVYILRTVKFSDFCRGSQNLGRQRVFLPTLPMMMGKKKTLPTLRY